MANSSASQRLESLDILRGFDIFMLVFFQPLFTRIVSSAHLPAPEWFMNQFNHVDWEGFAAWDLIMPLFLFMAGVAMPFSLSKYRNSPNKKPLYLRIVRRVIGLFILGAVVQGNLLALDASTLRLYSNTLQAIASGYLITAIILLNTGFKGQVITGGVLFAVYWAAFTFGGDFSPEGNVAEKIDQLVLGKFRDGVYWDESGWHFADWYRYTWIISSIGFGLTVLSGALAGEILRNKPKRGAPIPKNKRAAVLCITGVCLVLAAFLLNFQTPVIKKIWSASMVLLSSGFCFLLMSAFYYRIDCQGHSKGLNWLKIYGKNAIAAYVITNVINFRGVVNSLFFGTRQFLGDNYDILLSFGNYLIIFGILFFLYKRKIFLRV